MEGATLGPITFPFLGSLLSYSLDLDDQGLETKSSLPTLGKT